VFNVKLEELKSVSPGMVEKLNEIGVVSVESLIVKGINEVKTLLPEVDERELKDVFLEAWRKKGFWMMTAAEFAELEKERLVFSTGSKALNEILGGGLWSWNVAEFYGEMGVGKSQVLMTAIVEALVQNQNFAGVYIDAEGTCRESRIAEIAQKRGYDPEDIRKRLIFLPSVGTEILYEIVNRLPLTIEAKNVKIICVDSLVSPFRAEYIGREMLAPRQQAILRVADKLRTMARTYNLAVAISNQVLAQPTGVQVFGGFEYKPTGGFVLGHLSEPRVWVRRAQGMRRIARLVDSSWLPEKECLFTISDKGIEDVLSSQP